MLRGENIACGDATTGTGTLTLAATPAAMGSLDFRQWSTAINGFTTAKVLLVPYTIIEYTDSTFLTPSQVETGIGTLTLGASIGASTLARTTVMTTQTGSTYDESAPTALSIGTAANTLVFIANNAWGQPAFTPYVDQSLDDVYGYGDMHAGTQGGGYTPNSDSATGNDTYALLTLMKPVFAKVARIGVATAYGGTTGTPVSTAFASVYQMGTDGKPGRLLVDFGSFGTNPLNGTGIKTATAGTGILLPPGEYWRKLYMTWSGATGTVTHAILRSALPVRAIFQWNVGNVKATRTATGGANPAVDPANVTGWAAGAGNAGVVPIMGFAPS